MRRTYALLIVLGGLAVAAPASYWFFRTPPRQVPAEVPAPIGESGSIGQTVFLAVGDSTEPSSVPRMMTRELVRQAFLSAARDELGLSTRDVILREDFPKNPDEKSAPFTMACDVSNGSQAAYSLTRGSRDHVVWRGVLTTSFNDPKSLETLPEKAEALSHGEFKNLLTRAGANGRVPPPRASSNVPSAAYDLLWNWDEISVLAGLRRVHAEIRDKGESPELLAALAVGYANLGTLTEYFYSASFKACYARALLYSERLLRKTGQSPWALWHRAYVRAQVGLHNAAAEDIAAAKKDQSDAAPVRPLPFWTDVLDAFVQGDLARMLTVAKTPPERRLARYLNLQAAFYGELNERTTRIAIEFLQDSPQCPRAYAMLAAVGELDPRRQAAASALGVTGVLLRKRLPDVPGLPEPVAKRIRDDKPIADVSAEVDFRKALIADLKQAGAPELDRGEPSLSALGHLIDEIHYAQVMNVLGVVVNALGLPAEQEIAAFAPLCAAHPYAAYINAFGMKKTDIRAAADALSKKVEPFAVGLNEMGMLRWLYSMTPNPRTQTEIRIATQHTDLIFRDQMPYVASLSEETFREYILELWRISNKLPVVVALRISRDRLHAQKEAAKYERDYVRDPLVMYALADRYYRLKRYDDAERCAKHLVDADPSYTATHFLAAVYKIKGDHARWKETLDQAIKLPSLGLARASVQNEIALDLLEHKQWKEAAVYADAAAESYASWSMMTAARAHEMLGEWEKSEKLIRACAERYDRDMAEWMYWCHRTGHGDVHAADEFTRKSIEGWGTALRSDQDRDTGLYYLLSDQPEQALGSFQHAYAERHEPLAGIHAALAADALGKTATRDALLEQIVVTKLPPRTNEANGAEYYQQLVTQLRAALPPQSGPLNFSEIEKILAASSKTLEPTTLLSLVAAFLKNRGDLENAKKYLLRCAQSDKWQGFGPAFACQTLREMKVDVPPVDGAPKKAEPAKAPADKKPQGS